MRYVSLKWVYHKLRMRMWVVRWLISLYFSFVLTQAWNQRVPSSLLMKGVLPIGISCMFSTCYACLNDHMLCMLWNVIIAWKWIFCQIHISHVFVHLNMAKCALTSWDNVRIMFDVTYNVWCFDLTMRIWVFFKW